MKSGNFIAKAKKFIQVNILYVNKNVLKVDNKHQDTSYSYTQQKRYEHQLIRAQKNVHSSQKIYIDA